MQCKRDYLWNCRRQVLVLKSRMQQWAFVADWGKPTCCQRGDHKMKTKVLILFSLLTLCRPSLAREKTDVIVMRNGDRLTGEIKSLDSGVLYVRLDYTLGNISLDWTKVDHIESKQLFLITTQDGLVYSGTIWPPTSPGARPTKLEIIDSTSRSIELDKSRVTNIEQTALSVLQRFNGQIGLGATYSRGNQSTQYNLNSNVEYPRERWSASAAYTSNLTSSNHTTVSTRNEFELSGLRLLRWNNWYYTGLTDLLQSSQQGIALQATFGGGIGRYLKKAGRATVSVTGGLGWQQINYRERSLPSSSQQVTTALIATHVYLFRFDKTTLNIDALFLPALSDPGRLHFNLNTSYYIKMWRKLSWNISLYGNWDNHPPPGFSTGDYGSSTGISWRFGNR